MRPPRELNPIAIEMLEALTPIMSKHGLEEAELDYTISVVAAAILSFVGPEVAMATFELAKDFQKIAIPFTNENHHDQTETD